MLKRNSINLAHGGREPVGTGPVPCSAERLRAKVHRDPEATVAVAVCCQEAASVHLDIRSNRVETQLALPMVNAMAVLAVRLAEVPVIMATADVSAVARTARRERDNAG